MTNAIIKRRIEALELELKDLEVETNGAKKIPKSAERRVIKLTHELRVAQLLLEHRDNPIQRGIDVLFCLSATLPLVSVSLESGRLLLLLGLNFLALWVMLREARGLTQMMHRRSLAFWLVSEMGGTLPQWYQYRRASHRALVRLSFIFALWLIAYIQLSPVTPVSLIGIFMGLTFMVISLLIEGYQSRLDLAQDVYPLAKLTAQFKAQVEALDDSMFY